MARQFDGTDDTATITRSTEFEPAGAVSLGCWMKSPAVGANRYLVSKLLLAGEHPSWGFSTNGSSQVRFLLGWGTSAGNVTVSPASAAPIDDAWHHLLGTYDGTAVRFYVDGTEIGAGTAETHAISYAALNLYFGSFDSSILFYSGRLADVAVWSVALDAAARTALAKGTPANRVRRGALVGYWPLFGVATPEPDLTGQGNNATVAGAAAAAHAPVGPLVLPPIPAAMLAERTTPATNINPNAPAGIVGSVTDGPGPIAGAIAHATVALGGTIQ